MSWNKVSEVAPPKDRLIEVTSGFAWYPKVGYNFYDNQRLHQSPLHDKTYRTWKGRGAVILVIWDTDACLSKVAGGWVSPASDGIVPQDFQFWREYENPLEDDDLYTSAYPPSADLHERFDGNGTKSIMLAEVEKLRQELVNIGEMAVQEPQRIQYWNRLVENTNIKIEKLLADAETAYDLPAPYRE